MCEPQMLEMRTYESSSILKILEGMHFPRMFLDIYVALMVKILDLVNSLFYSPIFQDGRRVTGRAQGHGR